ncbi:MAG: ribonuclease P protein component [Deltaproteobacteria bacterium]
MEEKNRPSSRSQKFSKTQRLKKKKDFKFDRFKRFKTDYFIFVFSLKGSGRLGISLSKKILKSSVARNRIRRLLREVYRKNSAVFDSLDINVLGAPQLTKHWKTLSYSDVERQLKLLNEYLDQGQNG